MLLLVGASAQATAQSIAALMKIPLAPVLAILSMMKREVSFTDQLKKQIKKDVRQVLHGGPKTRHNLNVPEIASPGKKSPTQIVSDANNHYRAAFLVNSAWRVHLAPDPQAQLAREQSFWNMHVQASNRRLYASQGVEEAQGQYGDLLGWYATLDARTTPDCRAADGRNFRATDPPVIGYPGAVHLRCRCKPGRAHIDAKMVDDSSTVKFSPDASGFEKREGQ